MALAQSIARGFEALALDYSGEQVRQAVRYLELIAHWNRVTNLTAVRRVNDMVALHLLDSLAVQPFITGGAVLDAGSGAGLPGIPLALLNRDKDFILLDANGRKTRFMTQAKIELGLHNVRVVQSRAEDFSGEFDHVVCRAFGSLARFVSSCAHLVRAGGSLLAMQGPSAPAQQQGGIPQQIYPLTVPGLNAERYLIELKP